MYRGSPAGRPDCGERRARQPGYCKHNAIRAKKRVMADRERRAALFRRHLDLRLTPPVQERDVEALPIEPMPEAERPMRKKRPRRRTLSWVRPDEP